jgi:DNA invertase Pin-like site-specific DNA recombinase
VPKRAILYIRYSSLKQQEGDSVRRQESLLRRYASEKKLQILSEPIYDRGLSAYYGANIFKGGLGDFLHAVRQGKHEGDALLVENVDRLSRGQPVFQLQLFLELVQFGVEIHTVSDGRVYSKKNLNEIENIIIPLVGMVRGFNETDTKKGRILEKWAARRNSGKPLTAKCPAWLRLNRDSQSFEIIPERGEIIKEIFELAAKGCGKAYIAKKLNLRKPCCNRGISTSPFHEGRKQNQTSSR